MIGFSFLGMTINSGRKEDPSLIISDNNTCCLMKHSGDFRPSWLFGIENDVEWFTKKMLKNRCYQPPLQIKIKTQDAILNASRITSDTSESVSWKERTRVPLYDVEDSMPICAIFASHMAIVVCNNRDFLNSIVAISSASLKKTKTYELVTPEVIKNIEDNFNKEILSMFRDNDLLYIQLDNDYNPFLIFVKIVSEEIPESTLFDSTLNYTNLALISRKLGFLKACSKAMLSADKNTDFEDICNIYWIAFRKGITLREALNVYKEEKNQSIERLEGFLALDNI
jgi:hypothetical protein